MAFGTTASQTLFDDFKDAGVSAEEINEELRLKMEKVQRFLKAYKLAGILLTRTDNFAWVTAGIGDNHIVITSEVGFASILILNDGQKFLISSNTEVPHLLEEGMRQLGYVPLSYNWYDQKTHDPRHEMALLQTKNGTVASDIFLGKDAPLMQAEFSKLRYELTASEIKKYRWICKQTVQAVEGVCRLVKPGMSEREIEALTSGELMMKGLRPTALLIGVDDRIMKFYHYPPTSQKLIKYAIVNVCARRWGLVSSVGRYVHFGPVPDTLQNAFDLSAQISVRMIHHSTPTRKAGDLFKAARSWYHQFNIPEQWKPIHVGGAIGYAEREWIATDYSDEIIRENQCFAWNPFTKGALSFHTILVSKDGNQILTDSGDWPKIIVKYEGKDYEMPGVLVR